MQDHLEHRGQRGASGRTGSRRSWRRSGRTSATAGDTPRSCSRDMGFTVIESRFPGGWVREQAARIVDVAQAAPGQDRQDNGDGRRSRRRGALPPACEPTHGFWGVPPHDFRILDLFPGDDARLRVGALRRGGTPGRRRSRSRRRRRECRRSSSRRASARSRISRTTSRRSTGGSRSTATARSTTRYWPKSRRS